MTQETIDELLEAITLLLDDLKDIQENSYQMDQLMDQLESQVNDVEINIHGLEQNAQTLNDRLSQVLECVMSRAKEQIDSYKVIS
ncbi:hypothetical protein [Oceanobacillus massiliensis]|uniref:hypothetical protein n=1 Tax=Oceanobacillus massiliensis TaxID=1465765 RepID=UPI0002883A45|nr:hypothetical protein [Oceanobacillus massiliensis]